MEEILLIGCGRRGRKILAALTKLEEKEMLHLAGVVDPLPQRLTIPHYQTLSAALRQTKPTIAIIAAPNDQHWDIAQAVATRGMAIIKEKPLAPSFAEGLRYQSLPVRTVVLQSKWWRSSWQHISRMLTRHTDAEWLNFKLYLNDEVNSWYWNKAKGGGCWLNVGWHLVQLSQDLVGNVTQILLEPSYSKQRTFDYDTDDGFIAQLHTNKGIPIKLEASVVKPELEQLSVRFAEKMSVTVKPESLTITTNTSQLHCPCPGVRTTELALMEAIFELYHPNYRLEPWLRIQQVIEAGWISAQEGAWRYV